jgi:hypothetical protein
MMSYLGSSPPNSAPSFSKNCYPVFIGGRSLF